MNIDNVGLRIILSSKEIAESCIMLQLGKRNLEYNDFTSAGVNLYYSLFHACLSVLALTSRELDVKKCVSEFEYRSRLAPYYIPMSHKDVANRIREFDAKLSDKLNELKEIREYLSYGPNVFLRAKPKNEVLIFTCKIPRIFEKIERYSKVLDGNILHAMRTIKSIVGKGNFDFILIYFGLTTKILCRHLSLGKKIERGILNRFIRDLGMRNLVLEVEPRIRLKAK